MEDRFLVGIISKPHGIDGEVKVYPTTDDVNRFKKLRHVIMDTDAGDRSLEVERVGFAKQMVILKFKEFRDINEVEPLRGRHLYVPRKDAVELSRDEYFIADITGADVISTEGEELGCVKDVIQTGANDVYVVQGKGGEELLLPAIRRCIKGVDLQRGVITVFLMPGLRDI